MSERGFLIARRGLLAGAASLAAGSGGGGGEEVALWPGVPPGGGGPAGPPRVNARGAVWNVGAPSFRVFTPARANGAAVLVAAGGGYRRIGLGAEGVPAARWLAARGVMAFVLVYRLPGEGWAAGPAAPLQDAQRAMRLIRAGGYGVDPGRVSVLGFSAGGHLMGMLATCAGWRTYRAVDAADEEDDRPVGAGLVYPVITLARPFDRTWTRRTLVGEDPSAAAVAEWSVQTHVRAGDPPVFLTQAADDPVSNPQNTVIMQAACEKAGVPVEYLPLSSGGHGFGMGVAGTPTAAWRAVYSDWLNRLA